MKQGSGITKIKDWEVQLVDVVARLQKELLEINALLDCELKKAVPEYNSTK